MKTGVIANDAGVMGQLQLDPSRQLLDAHCNVTTAGGCLSSQYLAAWGIARR